jgi:hypothetical protein
LIIIGVGIAVNTYDKLKENRTFIELVTHKTLDFDEVVKAVETEFHLDRKSIALDQVNKVIILNTDCSAVSWGEQVTLILNTNNVLVNSRPSKSSLQSVTINIDRNHVARLKRGIADLLKDHNF